MNKKLIFFDIDGTLVSMLAPPSPAVREAIRAARANGHRVFLNTGRSRSIIGPDILAVGFDGIVASAGAYVAVGDTVLLDRLISEELVQECIRVFHDSGLYCHIETRDGVYNDPQMEELLRSVSHHPQNSEFIRMQREFQTSLAMRRFEDYPRQGAYKLCFTCLSMDSVRKAEQTLGDRFEFIIHAFASSADFLNGEIIPREVDKGRGIELVCRYLNAPLEDTIAFGDSMNDAAMLKRAGLAVAMGNACDGLKALADVVCEDVDHDGAALELRRMGLCQ